MKQQNEVKIILSSNSSNESFARMAVSAYFAQLDPTVEEISDIKTAVSEAVTNAIVHAYKDTLGKIFIELKILDGNVAYIKIKDKGCGIENIKAAMQPLFTTGNDERAGLGFSVMESFMDKIRVYSTVNKGTTVVLHKVIRSRGIDD